MNRVTRFLMIIVLVFLSFATVTVAAQTSDYSIKPGDRLSVSVWKEPDLVGEVLVRPDGKFSFPLAGDILAKGKSVDDVTQVLIERITKYIPEPVVTVQVQQILGNKIYVIGKVNRPGEFPLVHDMDVIQALSVAGGMATFASVDGIKILRRESGNLNSLSFRYGDMEDGENLEQNVMLRAGDVIVVP